MIPTEIIRPGFKPNINIEDFEAEAQEYYQNKKDSPTSEKIYGGASSIIFPSPPIGYYDSQDGRSERVDFVYSTEPVPTTLSQTPEDLRGGNRISHIALSKINFGQFAAPPTRVLVLPTRSDPTTIFSIQVSPVQENSPTPFSDCSTGSVSPENT